MSEWAHDALAADLLDNRHAAGDIACERLRVGPGYTSEGIQLDVAAMRTSWVKPMLTAYEVKVSRADLLADLRSGKWRKYVGAVERLYFAFPKGMADPKEIPHECGVLLRHDTIWRAARLAPTLPMADSDRVIFLTALLFRFQPAHWDATALLRRRVLIAAHRDPCTLEDTSDRFSA